MSSSISPSAPSSQAIVRYSPPETTPLLGAASSVALTGNGTVSASAAGESIVAHHPRRAHEVSIVSREVELLQSTGYKIDEIIIKLEAHPFVREADRFACYQIINLSVKSWFADPASLPEPLRLGAMQAPSASVESTMKHLWNQLQSDGMGDFTEITFSASIACSKREVEEGREVLYKRTRTLELNKFRAVFSSPSRSDYLRDLPPVSEPGEGRLSLEAAALALPPRQRTLEEIEASAACPA